MEALGRESANPEKLKILRDLGRAYLGMPMTGYARDEQKARAIIAQIQEEYAPWESSALMLRFDLTAPTRDSDWDPGLLFGRYETYFNEPQPSQSCATPCDDETHATFGLSFPFCS